MMEPFKNGLLIVIVSLLFIALLFTVRLSLSPLFLSLFLLYFLYPFRQEVWAKRTMGVTIGLFLLWLLSQIKGIISPFLVAFILAYIFHPLITKLEHFKIRRTLGIFLLALFFTPLSFLSLLFFHSLLG